MSSRYSKFAISAPATTQSPHPALPRERRRGMHDVSIWLALVRRFSSVGLETITRRRIKMGRIVVTELVSLDGVMEDPGGSEGWKYGGWTFKFSRGEAGDKFKVDEALSAEALLLGRVTYEGFAAAWPSRGGNEFADKF